MNAKKKEVIFYRLQLKDILLLVLADLEKEIINYYQKLAYFELEKPMDNARKVYNQLFSDFLGNLHLEDCGEIGKRVEIYKSQL
jgi:hypothetical protein